MRPRTFDEVEQSIRAQHEELRGCIRGLVRTAEGADLPSTQQVLRCLLLRFAARFDAHLTFEEREIGPRVRQLDAWGRAREIALQAEHRDQRRRIEEVCALAEVPGAGIGAFCEAVLELADRILEDMAHEDAILEQLARSAMTTTTAKTA